MSSTFIALPLTSGEAFLLRTHDNNGNERCILVDSGKKYGKGTRELAAILAKVLPPINHIDFAICTHSDSDHSNGFWSFADDWYGLERTLGEYWLPGAWANAMPDILTDPTKFVTNLMDGALRDSLNNATGNEEPKPGENNGDVGDKGSEHSVEARLGLTDDEAASLRWKLEETDDTIDAFDRALKSMQRISHNYWFYDQCYYAFKELHRSERLHKVLEASVAFQEVVETARAIRKIAMSALNHKILVRWFDFGKYKKTSKPKGGVLGLLEPCNSVEVRANATPPTNVELFLALRLSRQNVESLVFYRPETETEPGVLFLGDSRLAHGMEKPDPSRQFPPPPIKPQRKVVVTAPHHGSQNNDYAYTVLTAWLGSDQQYYIRNGGQTGQTLGHYKKLPDRRCAQCVQCHGKGWRQCVVLSTNGHNWAWPPNNSVCGAGSPNQTCPPTS